MALHDVWVSVVSLCVHAEYMVLLSFVSEALTVCVRNEGRCPCLTLVGYDPTSEKLVEIVDVSEPRCLRCGPCDAIRLIVFDCVFVTRGAGAAEERGDSSGG